MNNSTPNIPVQETSGNNDNISQDKGPDIPASGVPVFLHSLPNEAFSEVCELIGCSRSEIEKAISSSHISPEEAFATLRSIAPTCVAIKGSFETRRKDDINGAFCIIANGITGESINTTIWVGTQQVQSVADLKASWESLRESLRNTELSSDRKAYEAVEGIIADIFNTTGVNILFRHPNDVASKTMQLKELMSSALRLDVTCSVKVERFHQVRLDMIMGQRKQEETEPEVEKTVATVDINEVKVFCKAILDPVKGKSMGQLKNGELLDVHIDTDSPMGKIIDRIVKQSGKKSVFPVKSLLRMPSGDIQVELAITEGVIGIIKQPSEIKVRIVSPENIAETIGVKIFKVGPLATYFVLLGAAILSFMVLAVYLLY